MVREGRNKAGEADVKAAVLWVIVAALTLGVASSGAAGEMLASVPNISGGSAYPVIEIWKAQRRMQLREGDAVVREFRVSLGVEPREGKQIQGDHRTPVGRYYISEKKPGSRFHRFLGISYPNADDADRGYRRGLINASQWADIFFANLHRSSPPSWTVLGGSVGIHGFGGRPYVPVDWTEGCIAVSDEDIEYLYDEAPVGTPVIIHE
jgi:murein L,D-transpeptidase YafK